MIERLLKVRSVLFVAASDPRAVDAARSCGADLVVLDLEAAVRDADKGAARVAAVKAMQHGFGGLTAIRVNGSAGPEHQVDCRRCAGRAPTSPSCPWSTAVPRSPRSSRPQASPCWP